MQASVPPCWVQSPGTQLSPQLTVLEAVMRSRCEHYCKVVTKAESKPASHLSAWAKLRGTIGTREHYDRDTTYHEEEEEGAVKQFGKA